MGMLLSSAVISGGCSKPTPPSELLRRARLTLQKLEFENVESIVAKIPQDAPEWQAGQLLAGEAATKDARLKQALAYYTNAYDKDKTSRDGQLALFSAAEIYFELGELSRAETSFREVLRSAPDNGVTNERMAFLLSLTGRRWAALDHYFVLIKSGDANYRELALAADVGRAVEEPKFLQKCQASFPNDSVVRLAVATRAFSEGENAAESLLQSLTDDHPEIIAAQAMLGELIIDSTDSQRFLTWHGSLPPSANDSPDIWFVRGLWARKESQLQIAADCFYQTVVRSPFHRRAFYNLGQVLVAIDAPDAKRVIGYSELLIRLSKSVDRVLISEANDPKAIRQTAETLEKLGRIWEACAWGVIGRTYFPEAVWHAALLNRHAHELGQNLPRVVAAVNPVSQPLVRSIAKFDRLISDDHAGSGTANEPISRASSDVNSIRFEETDAFSFRYNNGEDTATRGVRTFEQTGGGVAILDFDKDTFPDAFLPQGMEWKTGSKVPTPSSAFRDGLFRNVAGKAFLDVSGQLTDGESGFGQGCTAGDYNNDGFPDLYVANIGRNALYQNMGDGTFSDVTSTANISEESWTASTMMCDLNSDNLPDIFDVNYLKGDDLFERICAERACSPGVFDGATDRVLINLGDGSFSALDDVTPQTDSKGLGVMAVEFQKNRRPTVFVANDQVANFFLRNLPADRPGNIKLQDDAVVSGVAYNDDGLPMACMGIAVDDWDRNNLLDLFVTNFHNEANTLYFQDAPGLFVDTTKKVGLYAPSLPFVSWGTQSLDADLDGWPDIVIANGHLDDYRDEGGEYHMRPQLFHNSSGRFKEVDASNAGTWFEKKHLGRGLATVDWNCDGRPEFIVSIINAPAAILKNTSPAIGNYIRFKLHATNTARDAIGTRVTIKTDNGEYSRQLLAGDGYMASNERVVNFGLGKSSAVDEVRIAWPSNSVTVLQHPRVNFTYIISENALTATQYGASEFRSSPLTIEDAVP